MAKHVVFVLDVSGSMNGKKLIQVKNAMKSILNQLRDIDFFSILHFSDVVTEWRLEATAATKGQKISIGNCGVFNFPSNFSSKTGMNKKRRTNLGAI